MTMPDLAPVKILVVDDLPEKHVVYRALLDEPGQEVLSAFSGEDALKALLENEFAVILLDINMPGMDGFETAAMIRARKATAHTPIIFITAFPDEVFALKGYALGAVDYILAPVAPNILRTKVGVFVQLYRLTQQVKSHAARQVAMAKGEQARLTAVLENAADFVARADARGRLLYLNAAGRRMLGLDDGDALQDVPVVRYDWLLPEDAVIQARRTGVWLGESTFENAAGESIPVSQVILAHRNDNDAVESFSVIARDMSEKKQSEEAIRELAAERARLLDSERSARAEAERLGRLKDEFLATLSHELRTPLNAILGWAKLLQGPATPAEDIAEGLEVIGRNALAQAQLVDELLDMNRIVSGKLQLNTSLLDVGEIVADAVETTRLSATNKGIQIDFDAPLESVLTVADGGRIRQIVWNLLSNAVKFTPKGGRVSVDLAGDANSVLISVTDTGEGIPAEFMPFLFDRFRQADASCARRHGGLGLGLAIVKQLAELHGGAVSAQSDGAHKGSTFTVQLPRRNDRTAVPAAPARPAQTERADFVYTLDERRLAGIRVLVVDDEPDSVHLARRVLEDCAAVVAVAYSAAEAFDHVRHARPDVVVSDIGMPKEDGYSLIQRIRREQNGGTSQIAAIALTAFARPEDRQRALDAGYQAHICKPVDPRELVRLVATVAERLATNTEPGHDLRTGESSIEEHESPAPRIRSDAHGPVSGPLSRVGNLTAASQEETS